MADGTPHGPGVAFGRIAAAIPVNDISQALGFYQDILRMSVTFANGDPVGFVILERDAAELHLTLVRGHKGGSHNAAHLMVADLVLVAIDDTVIRDMISSARYFRSRQRPAHPLSACVTSSSAPACLRCSRTRSARR
jgi:hypothetical protein